MKQPKQPATQQLGKLMNYWGKFKKKSPKFKMPTMSLSRLMQKLLTKIPAWEQFLRKFKICRKKQLLLLQKFSLFVINQQKHLSEIEGNKKKSEQLRDDIQKNLDIATEKRSEVEKIADLITDTGFANSFQNRAKLLRRNSYIWLAIFSLGIVALSILLYFIFDVKEILLYNGGEIPKWESLFLSFNAYFAITLFDCFCN